VVVGGAVSADNAWGKLEASWSNLLKRSKVTAYHWKEFQDRDEDFKGWSDFKRKRFVETQEKIINSNALFRVSIGLESAVHAEIKGRMKGIKGFVAESDYSLCLRYLMFHTSEQLLKVDRNHRLAILVEDGPWASGALTTYQRVSAMIGKWKPAKHAHRLAGFAMAPKGKFRSLEAADYIAGSEHARMLGGDLSPRHRGYLSMLLTRPDLERWYEGMMAEKENRRAFNRKQKTITEAP
jgi:hypothetical protein